MVIYTNNLAEKLFGFAMSKDQLKNTGLCSILEDPNLQLDIDLAIDFNAAVRGDEDAAERFTNALILSSAFLDYSTVDFYTTRMEQYPVFEYQVDRVTYVMDNIDDINDYYAATSAREKDFIDNLKNALKDCLNSPCNLFAESSESIASIIDNVAASNTTTNLSFSAVKDKTETFFRTTYGGIKNTLIKQLPDAVTGMIGKIAILGQDAWDQSVDILFEKDTEKKDKLIANALAGRALDYEATGYTYIPDIDSITSLEGFASSVLSQAASDLGGCFRKYQHLARYSQFDEEQNLGRASTNPIQANVDGNDYRITTSGQSPVGGYDRANELNCRPPVADPDIPPPGASSTTRNEQLLRVMRYLKGSRFDPDANGGNFIIPKDGEIYGIKNGTLEEWANFFVNLADVESTFRPARYVLGVEPPANINDAKSFGLYQLGLPQFSRFSGINIKRASDNNAWADPDKNTQSAIKYAEELYFGGGEYGSKGGVDRIATKSNEGISAGFGPLRNIAKGKPTENETKLIVDRVAYQNSTR